MNKPSHRSRAAEIVPGFLLTIALGALIWFVSKSVSWVDPLLTGILCGMLLRAVIGERRYLAPGFAWTPAVLIPPGIILYAAHLRFDTSVVSPLIWFQLTVGLIIAIWIARSIGTWLGLRDATSLLIGVGTAICGASAIIIARDAVEARARDTATALVVITVWGLVGLVVLPPLARYLDMSIQEQGLLYATTLHQTGLVKAAAVRTGDACLAIAMAIKSARTIGIIPLLLIAGTLHHLPQLTASRRARKQYKVRIAWYLWAFIAAGICFNVIPAIAPAIPTCKFINAIIWTMAMTSIGLTVNIKQVFTSIGKPLIAGLLVWVGILVVFLYTFLVMRS